MHVKITDEKPGVYTEKLNQQQSKGESGLGGMQERRKSGFFSIKVDQAKGKNSKMGTYQSSLA